MLFRIRRSALLIIQTLSWMSMLRFTVVNSLAGVGPKSVRLRSFAHHHGDSYNKRTPKLILVGGCTGTGKSTFGMSLALEQEILKCISTDTVRAVMRGFSTEPSLHRSSFTAAGDDDNPVVSWKETCAILESSVETLIDDAIERKISLVMEGVSLIPSKKWLNKWEASGGAACGVLLTVSNEEAHRSLLKHRGFQTGQTSNEEKKLNSFDRVRLIQDEMVRLAKESEWIIIDQKLELDPLDEVALKLEGRKRERNGFQMLSSGQHEDQNGRKQQQELSNLASETQ